ncbi:unnamed protein product [Effrenium voratum]|nr:unnamed protein product [Effrenium voratum]
MTKKRRCTRNANRRSSCGMCRRLSWLAHAPFVEGVVVRSVFRVSGARRAGTKADGQRPLRAGRKADPSRGSVAWNGSLEADAACGSAAWNGNLEADASHGSAAWNGKLEADAACRSAAWSGNLEVDLGMEALAVRAHAIVEALAVRAHASVEVDPGMEAQAVRVHASVEAGLGGCNSRFAQPVDWLIERAGSLLHEGPGSSRARHRRGWLRERSSRRQPHGGPGTSATASGYHSGGEDGEGEGPGWAAEDRPWHGGAAERVRGRAPGGAQGQGVVGNFFAALSKVVELRSCGPDRGLRFSARVERL